jgi:large subunit ribosomal protein L9
MKIILTQAVPGLGEAGAVKEVADGYARNYLLPRKLAMTATKGSMKQAMAQAEVYTRRAQKVTSAAQQAAAALEGKVVKIRARVGSENRLYGSVTAADIAEALHVQYGIELDRRKIEVEEVIHRTGSYAATADFGQGATGKFTVEVAPEVQGAHGKASQVAGATMESAEGSEPVQAQDEVATGDTAVDDTATDEADATADDAATDDSEAGDTAQG